jgi:hypothetical protein
MANESDCNGQRAVSRRQMRNRKFPEHVSHKNVQRYNGPFRRDRTKGRKLRPSPQERRSKSGKLIRVNDEFLLVGVSMVFEATSP